MKSARATVEGRDPPAVDGARRVRLSRELSLYLIRSTAVYSLVALIMLDTVLGMIGVVRVTAKYNVDFLIILPVLLRAMGQAMVYTLPVSLLFGTSLLIGRLRSDREILSFLSFGVSPWQLFVPIVLAGLVLSAISYPVNNWLGPHFRYQNRNIASFVMDQLPYLGEGWGLEFSTGSHEVWVQHHVGGELEGIFMSVSQGDASGPFSESMLDDVETPTYPFYLFAERARVVPDKSAGVYRIEFEGVSIFLDSDFFDSGSSEFVQRGYLADWVLELPVDQKNKSIKDRSGPELAVFRDVALANWQRLEAEGGDPEDLSRQRRRYFGAVREAHRRLAIALSCLTFPLAAFAIGLFLSSMNRLLPFFVASTVVPATFFGLELVGGELAQKGIVPWASEQLGNIALVVLSAFLYWRTVQGPRK